MEVGDIITGVTADAIEPLRERRSESNSGLLKVSQDCTSIAQSYSVLAQLKQQMLKSRNGNGIW